MVAAQVIGNDATITIAGQAGNFQLNVMLPVIAHNLLQSIEVAGRAAALLGERAIATFRVREDRIRESLDRNPILITALNARIGYDLGARIAKQAYKEGRPLIEVARELTDLDEATLRQFLDPAKLTEGGIVDPKAGGG
jgi:fumarate hydratase class II